MKKRTNKNYSSLNNKTNLVDKIIIILVAGLIGIFPRPDIVLIVVLIFTVLYLFFTKRTRAFKHLLIGAFIALVWIIIAKDQYHYNREMGYLIGLPLYPLVAWTLGLFGSYLIYSYEKNRLNFRQFWKKIFLYLLIYWPLLIFVETIAFHITDFRNLGTSIYSGLPICNCIHAPFWMQISYFLIGPIYFLSFSFFERKKMIK